ncbi:MAG: domain protein putative component of TonB system [Bryobacterales bacterium]|nr:domain protein putative component of TonB system [Bryobacterales bacterium]
MKYFRTGAGFHFAALVIFNAALCAADSLSEALISKRYQDALALADTLLASQPRDFRAWTARGMALAGLARDRESVDSFEKALQLAPDKVAALQRAIEVGYRSRDPRTSTFLNRLLQISPENGVAHAMAAVIAFEAGDCSGAIQHFEHGIQQTTKSEQAYALYGACLLKTQRAREAVAVFERLVAGRPDNPSMLFNLGYAQLLAHHAGDAVKTLTPLAEAPGALADVLNLIASAESGAGQTASAIVHLRRAIATAPADDANYLDLAAIFLQRDAMEAAAEIAETGLKNVPSSARLHSLRGVIKAQAGSAEEAASDFELANRLDSTQEYGAAGLGLLYTETRKGDLAISVLRDRLKKVPGDSMLNYLLAQAMMLDDVEAGTPPFEQVERALKLSIQSKPDFARAHTLLGKLYARAGENRKAAVELELAREQNRYDRTTLSQLATVYKRLGRTADAAAALSDLRQMIVQESQSKPNLAKVP